MLSWQFSAEFLCSVGSAWKVEERVSLSLSKEKKKRSERLTSDRKEILCFFFSCKVETSPDLLAYDGITWFCSLDSSIRFVMFSSGKDI